MERRERKEREKRERERKREKRERKEREKREVMPKKGRRKEPNDCFAFNSFTKPLFF